MDLGTGFNVLADYGEQYIRSAILNKFNSTDFLGQIVKPEDPLGRPDEGMSSVVFWLVNDRFIDLHHTVRSAQ